LTAARGTQEELRALFGTELLERVQLLDRNLDQLMASSAGRERALLETATFFEAHRLKGAAGTLGLHELESVAAELARSFDGTRTGENDVDVDVVEAARRKLSSAAAELRAAGVEQPGSKEAAGATCTVLHVEDDPVISAFVERVLVRQPSAKLVSARTGEAALRAARERSPDLVLLDLRLPDMRGVDVFRLLREDPATRGIPVVITTGGGMSGEVEHLLADGALGCLEKPIDIHRLRELVDGFVAAKASS
jgi:two-component system, cell cycle response regulator DivK